MDTMNSAPAAVRTFLIAHLRGFTDFAAKNGDEPALRLAQLYGQLAREVVREFGGDVVELHGEELLASFRSAQQALRAGVSMQARCTNAMTSDPSLPLHVAIGLDSGEAVRVGSGYRGRALNLAARLCSLAEAGTVLASEGVIHLAGALSDLSYSAPRALRVKGIPEPVVAVGVSSAPQPVVESRSALRRHNLPAALTSFVGREDTIRDIRLCFTTSRMITLIGPGGSGKTRLGIAVARTLVEEEAEGVWLVELASISDPAALPHAVARALSISERGGGSPLAAIADGIGPRPLLLVLDNCEHLADACARLAEYLLGACPELRILATSREPLIVPGEINWLVPPLAVPTDGAVLPPDALAEVESVRLFVDRARQRQPGFTITTENSPAVARICRQVDGLPLAIELAAARIGLLTVDQIATRLGKSLDFLTAGAGRTAPTRHQTLRATLDWSYDLLDGEERDLFMRLSVFARGWTLEHAEDLVGGDGSPLDTLDILCQLVDKSWVVAEASSDGSVRYRMLEPVRQYAFELLEHAGCAAVTEERHARLFLSLAMQAGPGLRGPEQPVWLKRLDQENDNLQTAFRWLLGHDDVDGAARLATALERFWFIRGHLAQASRSYNLLIDREAEISDKGVKVFTFIAAADHQESYERMKGCHGRALTIARETGNERCLAYATVNAIVDVQIAGDTALADDLFTRGLELSDRLRDPWDRGNVLLTLALAAGVLQDYPRARDLLQRSLAEAGRSGDPRAHVTVTYWLAMLELDQGNHDRARPLFEETASKAREIGDLVNLVQALSGLGRIAGEQNRPEAAASLLREGLGLAAAIGALGTVARVLASTAGLATEHGDARRAAKLLGFVDGVYGTYGLPPYPAENQWIRRLTARTQAHLDATTWSAARANGRDMTKRDAVALGLEALAAVTTATHPSSEAEGLPASLLSAREREVAGLVAQGLTNRQIAARLVIAERTVDTHVGNILSKLGLGSRTQVAAWLAAHED
jgi:predicted ATPase/class 3 adenylate cyclase/DNA-binding CsgD family transcriptional regulator